MRILNESGGQHWDGFGLGYGYPSEIWHKRRQRVCFIYKESVEVPGMGLGESYTGLFGEGPYSKTATGQKTLNTGRGLYLRGPAGDVTLCHYGACDICQSFGDVVCVMAPATAVYICKRWCQYRAL